VQRLNRYYRRSRIAEAKFRLLIRHFALDLHAADAAQLTGVSHRSVITIFGKIRWRIAEECERQSPFKNGEVEVDESYFGPHRVRGKRGRGAGRKTIVFGLLKRDSRVYTEIVPDCKRLLYRPLSAAESRHRRSSTRTAGAATTDSLMSGMPNTSESIMAQTSSSTGRGTSTVLRASGAMPNVACRSSMEYLRRLSSYT
jgi:hypothetical protein